MVAEIAIIITAVLVLASGFAPKKYLMLSGVCAITGVSFSLGWFISLLEHTHIISFFGGQFQHDSISTWLKIIFLFCTLIVIFLSLDNIDDDAEAPLSHISEYLSVLLFSLSGAMFLVSSRDIITQYVSLELATIPLFILSAWQKQHYYSIEAGVKYVVIGALSSALLLFGLGFLYGIGKSMQFAEIQNNLVMNPVLWISLSCILAGVGFKMTLFPFHFWAADVYQGSPTPITAYLSVASKTAGFTFLFQILYLVIGKLSWNWDIIIIILAVATMTFGNLAAIVQEDIKRFMAFSSISQAGYILLGFLNHAPDGLPAMVFYLLVYAASNLAVFAVITYYTNQIKSYQISDFYGLALQKPLMALSMMIALFSLAGIPPLSGFVGKFFLFKIAAQAGYHWVVFVSAVNSTISLYYYLKIIRKMYIQEGDKVVNEVRFTHTQKAVLIITILPTIFLGIIPMIYELIHQQLV